MQYRILVTLGKNFSSLALKELKKIGKVDLLSLDQQTFEKKIAGYDIALVGLGLKVSKKVIENAQRLKLLATATTGTDHLDISLLQKKGVNVLSLKDETFFLKTITGTAELAFGLLLDLSRHLSFSFESVKNYHWEREKFRGHNLFGKTLGIVGYGRLGQMMAHYAQAFGMKVFVFDPYLKKVNKIVQRVSFDKLLKESDVVSIHVHLNKETENMFTKKELSKMKSGAYLINTARGKIVNEVNLLAALKNKKIGGYAADVLAGELEFGKNFFRNPLVEYAKKNENCIIVPHIGGMTYESREATDVFIVKKILKWCK